MIHSKHICLEQGKYAFFLVILNLTGYVKWRYRIIRVEEVIKDDMDSTRTYIYGNNYTEYLICIANTISVISLENGAVTRYNLFIQ